MQADIVAIAIAFILGFGARFVALPPLVGYLVAGFALYAAGMRVNVVAGKRFVILRGRNYA